MAIGNDGNLYAWGGNDGTVNLANSSGVTTATITVTGVLGDGTTAADHPSPEVITLGTGVAPEAVSAGPFDTLAIGAACSGTPSAGAPTCPGTPSNTPTPSHTPTPMSAAGPGTSPAPSAHTSAAPSALAVTAAVHVPAAVAQGLPVGAPETGGGTGSGIGGAVVAAGVAVMAAGTGLVVVARRRRRRRPPV